MSALSLLLCKIAHAGTAHRAHRPAPRIAPSSMQAAAAGALYE
jgi:hypothetical protein